MVIADSANRCVHVVNMETGECGPRKQESYAIRDWSLFMTGVGAEETNPFDPTLFKDKKSPTPLLEWKKKITPPYMRLFMRKKQILSERKSVDAAKIFMFRNLMYVIEMFKWLIFQYPTFHFNIFSFNLPKTC